MNTKTILPIQGEVNNQNPRALARGVVKEKKKPGRPPIDPEKKRHMVAVSLNNAQREKMRRLGGSKFIQQAIDKAKDERPEPCN